MAEEKKQTTSKKVGRPKGSGVKKSTSSKKTNTSKSSSSSTRGKSVKKKTNSKGSTTRSNTLKQSKNSTTEKSIKETSSSLDTKMIYHEIQVESKSAVKARDVKEQDFEEKNQVSIENQEKKADDLRVIPISNYLIVGIVLVWILILGFIGYKLTQKYQEKLYDEGYFLHEKTEIQKASLSEIPDVIQSSTSTLFVLFNYRGMEETYDLEKDLLGIMKDYHIQDNFYYVDMTSFQEEGKDLANEVNEALNIRSLLHVPAILYYQDGRLISIAQREDQKVLEAADFVKILDMYEFQK